MTQKYQSLPDFLRNPICLLWAGILPQVILLILNLRAWILVRGEATPEHTRLFAIMGGSELVILLALAAVLSTFRIRKRLLGWIACVPLFLVHIAYLWFITRYVDEMLPREVTLWMLPQHVHLFTQFALVMPATFYLAARVACFPLTSHPLKDMGITTGALMTFPVLWYVVMRFATSHRHGFTGPAIAWILFWVVTTVLTVMAFLRLLMMLYTWTRKVQSRRWIFVMLAAVAAPVGGLALNTTIPFPVDLQYPAIYILTALNALVLLIPRPSRDRWLLPVWFARGAMMPFSLYFFLLFLPFLPLALPAMFAVGAGFLILAPTFLFAIHTQMLIDEGKQAVGAVGRRYAAACMVAAFLIIPGVFTVDALIDRVNLNAAIDAVYTPDTLARPRISARRAAKALKRLDADKRGVYLPFLSGAYRQLVFDGMILPDHKIAEMYKVFTGDTLESKESARGRADMFNLWTLHRGTGRNSGVRPPPRTVALESTAVSSREVDGMIQATLTLTMTNGSREGAEFIARLKPSPGVLVTGYWLEIEGEKRYGRLYEKRAALWVYHMIRDMTRRDPGLLIYEDPQTLKLNVFPFTSGQTRVSGIEFLFPAPLRASVAIGAERVDLMPEAGSELPAPLLLKSSSAPARVLALPADSTARVATTSRRPVINLLLDRSRWAAEVSSEKWRARLDQLRPLLPEDSLFRVSAVNHSSHVLNEAPLSFAEAQDATRDIDGIKPEGGLAPYQAIRRGIAHWREQSVARQRETVPLFVLLTAPGGEPTAIESLRGMECLTPDVTGYWIHDGSSLSFRSYDGDTTQQVASVAAPPALLFPVPDGAQAIVPGRAAAVLVRDADASLSGSAAASDAAAQYIAGLTVWQSWYDTLVNPSLLDANYKKLVNDSRAAGVMTPVTSFMVVENTAQEEMLNRKHTEALDAKSALDFDEHQESPEPALWLLLIPVFLLAGRKKRVDGDGSVRRAHT